MIITWYGEFCFRIEKGSLSLLIDPLPISSGLKMPRIAADILVLGESSPDGARHESLKQSFIINAPGEYEIKEAFIRGISFGDEGRSRATIFVIELESLVLVHLGALALSPLPESIVEELGDVDILLIPVGGKEVLDAEGAEKIFGQLEPKVVIPMAYKIPGLKTSREEVRKFEKILGHGAEKAIPKLVLKKKDLSLEESRVVILEPQ